MLGFQVTVAPRASAIIRRGTWVRFSVMKGGASARPTQKEPSPLCSPLCSDSAFALAKLVGMLPDVVADAAEKYEPSLLTRHVMDIAQAFSAFYHEEPILTDDEGPRMVKLAITAAAGQAIRNGLALLGVSAPERM